VTVELKDSGITNCWEIWVYPHDAPPAPPADVTVAQRWDEAAKSALAEGRKVVLFAGGRGFGAGLPGRFLPVFWSPIWFPQQSPNTMGILCDPRHAALAKFPTEFYSNWQWHDLLQNSRSLILDDTPAEFRPIVQVIDNFARNHKLGNLFEAKVGRGRLLVCAIDLPWLAEKQPAAAQLLRSLFGYVGSDAFAPQQELPLALLDKLLASPIGNAMQRLGAHVIHADSEAPDYEAAKVIDGDPNSIWHTPWGEGAPGFPHELMIEFARPFSLQACKLLPRQDMKNGLIKDYEIYVSLDGKQWGQPVAKGRFAASQEMRTVKLKRAVQAKYLKLVALSNFEKGPFISLAELEVVEAGK
jgi:F5/8 type C domain